MPRQACLVHGFTYLFLACAGGLGCLYMIVNTILTGYLRRYCQAN